MERNLGTVNRKRQLIFLAGGIFVASIAQRHLFPQIRIVNYPIGINNFYLIHPADVLRALGGVLLYVVGMALTIGGLRRSAPPDTAEFIISRFPSQSARRVTAAYALALTALLVNLGALWCFGSERANRGLLLWLSSLLLFMLACWIADHPRATVELPSWHQIPLWERLNTIKANKQELALLALVLTVGIGFRFYQLDAISPGLNDDAAWNGLYAIELAQRATYTPYSRPTSPGGPGHETMFHYFTAALMALIGETSLAVKMTSAIVGVLHLFASYLLARELFGRQGALIATVLLATSGWHITMSKVGWRAISLPLFETLCFYFLWRGFRTRRYLDFALSGLALGLTLNAYHAGYVTPFIVLLLWLHRMIGLRGSPSLVGARARLLRLGSAMASLTALTLTPLLAYVVQHGDAFTQRARLLFLGARLVQAGNLEPLWRNLATAAGLFNLYANGDDFFLTRPLLDFPISVFWVLGLGYCLSRWRDKRYLLLLVWSGGALGLGVLSIPNGNRCIGAIAPVYFMGGIFLERLARALRAALPSGGSYRRAVTAGLAGVLLAISVYTYHDYIGPNRHYLFGFDEDAVYVGAYINTLLQENYQVYLAEYYYAKRSVQFATWRPGDTPFARRYVPLDEAALQQLDLTTGPPVALLLRPPNYLIHDEYRVVNPVNDTSLRDLIATRYPEVPPIAVRSAADPAHVVLHAHLLISPNAPVR